MGAKGSWPSKLFEIFIIFKSEDEPTNTILLPNLVCWPNGQDIHHSRCDLSSSRANRVAVKALTSCNSPKKNIYDTPSLTGKQLIVDISFYLELPTPSHHYPTKDQV